MTLPAQTRKTTIDKINPKTTTKDSEKITKPAKAAKSEKAKTLAPKNDDRVTHLPGLGKVDNTQFAGFSSIYGSSNPSTHSDEALFYWFVGAENYSKKPTILWTNGGPGSSSFWGFFLENGPYRIDDSGNTLTKYPEAWNNYANYMIFEHPLSVTLSIANDPNTIPKTVEQGIDQLYQALLNVVDKHPEIANNPIILAGESYAGTYLPLLAKAILKGNQKGNTKLDLRLMVLCDAWVNPEVQMATDTTWAYSHGLISASQKHWLDKTYADRLPLINAAIQKLCGCYMTNIAQLADPSFQPIYDYLNKPDVREALHIPVNYPKMTQNWSEQISDNYAAHVNDSFAPVVQELLDGCTHIGDPGSLLLLDGSKLKVSVVSGLNDAKDCNFMGTGAWLDLLEGDAALAYQLSPPTQWLDAKKNVLGFSQSGGQLGWLKVLNAGHMAARDQPALIHYILAQLEK